MRMISSCWICGCRADRVWKCCTTCAPAAFSVRCWCTAQDAIDAKVQALRAGADDYVTKPFAFEEFLARVEALSRRPLAIAEPQLRVKDLELDKNTRTVRRAGRDLEL